MKFWQVDAFTDKLFCGNPAAVFILDKELTDQTMQNIALEMNLSETVFVTRGNEMKIRWFTPAEEVDLCGHGTLAAAHILWTVIGTEEAQLVFQSASGPLSVYKTGQTYTLDFPLQAPSPKSEYESHITDIIGVKPEYIGSNGHDCIAVVASPSELYKLSQNLDLTGISKLPERGLLVTTQDKSGESDYIYRAFFPKLSVTEDPVTGSANTGLAPYWAERLNKTKLTAKQVSERGGDLTLEVKGNRVLITGKALTVFEGKFVTPIEEGAR